jgi:hypothetical protein
MPKLFCLALLLVSSPVSAASVWDGDWFFSPQKSHLSDHSFTLTKVAGGAWRYDDGGVIYLFKTDGRTYPEPLDPSLIITAAQPNPRRLDLMESSSGKPVQRLSKVLSVDGSRLTSLQMSISPDGGEHALSATDVRKGAGSGLEGTWTEMATVGPSSPISAQSNPSWRPHWVITHGDGGEMTWRIPRTGETLTGKLDGRARPAVGPAIPSSEAFYWEPVSEKQIEFYYLVNGHLVERATELMAEDGTSWSDSLWIPAYPDQKDVRVFERR